MLYNTTIYCLLYVVLYKERPMVYLSITVVFYSWTCCIENLVVGAMLMLQADTVRSALENPTRSWLFWINQLLALCGCAAIRKAITLSASDQWFTKWIHNSGHHIVGVNSDDRSLAKRVLSGRNQWSFPVLFCGNFAVCRIIDVRARDRLK